MAGNIRLVQQNGRWIRLEEGGQPETGTKGRTRIVIKKKRSTRQEFQNRVFGQRRRQEISKEQQ